MISQTAVEIFLEFVDGRLVVEKLYRCERGHLVREKDMPIKPDNVPGVRFDECIFCQHIAAVANAP